MRGRFGFVVLLLLAAGCAGGEAKRSGPYLTREMGHLQMHGRTYAASFERTWVVALRAIERAGARIARANRSHRTIRARDGSVPRRTLARYRAYNPHAPKKILRARFSVSGSVQGSGDRHTVLLRILPEVELWDEEFRMRQWMPMTADGSILKSIYDYMDRRLERAK